MDAPFQLLSQTAVWPCVQVLTCLPRFAWSNRVLLLLPTPAQNLGRGDRGRRRGQGRSVSTLSEGNGWPWAQAEEDSRAPLPLWHIFLSSSLERQQSSARSFLWSALGTLTHLSSVRGWCQPRAEAWQVETCSLQTIHLGEFSCASKPTSFHPFHAPYPGFALVTHTFQPPLPHSLSSPGAPFLVHSTC